MCEPIESEDNIMGFCEVLTIIFIVLKLIGAVSWSWWLVCLPGIIALALYLISFILGLTGVIRSRKSVRKKFLPFQTLRK